MYLYLLCSKITNWLVRSLCQSCRPLSRQGRYPWCTTRRWIYIAISKTMEARISQNTRLTKKKGSCRVSIVRWAWLLGNTSSPHWNSSRHLLHAVQPPRNHGQKPSWTMYRIIQWNRVWAILGGQDKMMEYWLFSLLLLRDYSLSLGLLCLFWMVLLCSCF